MRITELLAQGPTLSFEFFPPKPSEDGARSILDVARRLITIRPASFLSVTCKPQDQWCRQTLALAQTLQTELGTVILAHVSCGGKSLDDLKRTLDDMQQAGIHNLLALRGDPEPGQRRFVPHPDGFAYASELVAFMRERYPGACIGAACYPEGHIESTDPESDLHHLKTKVQAGTDFLITQLFYDHEDYLDFVVRARKTDIHVPIIPGIMPIASKRQLERFQRMCRIQIPAMLARNLDAVSDENLDNVHRVSRNHLASTCRALETHQAPGLHIYTVNRYEATAQLLAELTKPST